MFDVVQFSILKCSKQNKQRKPGFSKRLVHRPSKVSEFQIVRYENHIFKDVPIAFLVFLKYFGDKYGVRGSIFGHIVGRSKNVPKSIAIDQEL